jgi:hypothetical protein
MENKKENKPKLIFHPSAFPFILDALGFKIIKGGFISKKKTNEIPLDDMGKKIKAKRVIAVKKDEVTGEPKFYQSIGEMLNDKYGIFM